MVYNVVCLFSLSLYIHELRMESVATPYSQWGVMHVENNVGEQLGH